MLDERHLRSIYDDEKSFFNELLEIDSSVSIRDRNLRALAIEMHKIDYGIAPTIIDEIFTLKNQDRYNLGNYTDFLVFQKLEALIMVLRVLGISVP